MAYYLTPAERRARAQALIEQRKNVVAYNKYLKQQKDYEKQVAQAKLDEENRQKQIESQDFFTRAISTVGDISANIITGALKGLEGIYDLGAGIVGAVGGIFSDDFQDSVKSHIATDWVGKYIGDPLQELTKYSYTKNGGIIEGVASGIGQMLPAVAVTIATGGAGAPAAVAQMASLATLGASAAGNATEQAYNDGASYWGGLGYGLASGAVEMATEKMFGGFGKLAGAGYLDNVTRSIAKQGIARVAKEAVEEGVEEIVAELANPALKAIYKGGEAFQEYGDADYWKGVGEAGLIGGLTSMAYGQTVGRVLHSSGKYADVNEALAEVDSLAQKARNLSETGKLYEKAKNGKVNSDTIHDSMVENLRLIEQTVKKVDETKRAKFIKQAHLTDVVNPDGSIKSEFAMSRGLSDMVAQQSTEGGETAQSPLASQPKQYRTAFADERVLKEALDRGGATAFVGEMTSEQASDFGDFTKVFGKLSNKSNGFLKFVVGENVQGNSYIDTQTGTAVMGVDQFGKGTSGVDLANAVITSDMWQKSAIHEVKHSTEGTKQDTKLTQHLYDDNAVFAEARDSFLRRGYFNERVDDTSKAGEYLDGLLVKVDEVMRSKPKNVSMEEHITANLTSQEIQDYRTAQSEIAAIAAENVLGNESFIKKLLRKDTNFAQKVLNRIMDMKEAFASLKSKEARNAYTYLNKAEKLYLKAIEEVGARFQKRRIIGIRRLEEGEEVDASPQSEYNGEEVVVQHSRKDSLINRTFPTYKESAGSEANTLATRWAHRADIQAGDQTLISYHDNWYVVQKFDDSDLGYQIMERIAKKDYDKIAEDIKRNGASGRIQSIQRAFTDFAQFDKQRDSSRRAESSPHSLQIEHGGENSEVLRDSKTATPRGQTQNDGGGDSKSRRSSKQGLKYSFKEVSESALADLQGERDLALQEEKRTQKVLDSIEGYAEQKEKLYKVLNDKTASDSAVNAAMEEYAQWEKESGYGEAYKANYEASRKANELRREVERMGEELSKKLTAKKFTTEEKSRIKHSLKDSEGKTLSEGQQKYFKDSKVRDNEGNLLVVYHGTMSGDFTVFDASYSNVESDLGAGFYFSSDYADVNNNYENGGEDLEAKIERLAERIAADEDIDEDEAKQKARKQLSKKSKLFEVYLDMKNPAYVGGNFDSSTYLFEDYFDFSDIQEDDYESDDEYWEARDERVEELIQELVDKVDRILSAEGITGYEGWEQNLAVMGAFDGGVTITDMKNTLNEDSSLWDCCDSKGNMATTELVRAIIEALGYDGIIDNSVVDKFGYNSGRIQYMEGIDEETRHFVVFKPEQIKLTDNLNPTTNEDIRFSRKVTDEIKKTYYHLSDGQIKKMLANSTRYKVYSKADAEGIINNVLQNYMSFGEKYGDMSGKTKAQVIDMLWKGLNSAKPGYQMSVALNIADYIIQNSILESLYGDMENGDVQQALDIIGALKPYLHNINLDSLKGEIKYKYDKDNSAYLLWGKRKGERGYGADQIAQELQEVGIFIDAINEAEIFFEIDAQYRNAVKALKKRAKEMLSESLSKEQQKELRQEIAREVLRGFDYTGKPSQLAGILDKYRKQISTLYDKLRDSKRYNRATNRLLDKVQQIKNWKTGAFVNSSKYRPQLFKGSIERLAMIKNRGNLNQSGTRRILAGLAEWYAKDNPILGFVDDEQVGLYNGEIASILQAVAQNQKPLTDEQVDLISYLQDKSGISDYKGLLEWYTKENLKKGYSSEVKSLLRELASETTFTTEELIALEKVVGYFGNLIENYNKVIRNGKYVDAKPIAERYVNTLRANKTVKVGWIGKFFDKVFNNGKASYLQTFADPMTVARYMDKYESGFFTEMLEELRNGAIRADVTEMKIRMPLEEFLAKHKKYGRGVSKRTVTYGGVELPALDAFLLYMTLNREQALAGLAEAGFAFNNGKETIRVDGFAKGSEDLTLDELRELARAEQEDLYKQFTEEDKEYISIAEKIFNEDCKETKRAMDMLRMGYSNVFEGYYVPIRRANSAVTVDSGTFFDEMNRVSNASFNKDTVRGAKGELYIEGLDEVLDRHIHGISQYASLATVIDQYDILYNVNMAEDANKPQTVRTESENTWAKGNEYFKKLISDVQGISPTRGGGSKLFGFLRSGYAKYQLGLNPKVWLTQLSSIFASSSILDYSSIVKGFGIKSPDVDDYCSLAAVRNNDNSAAMAQSVLDKVDKFGSALMKPIGKVDRFVIKRLFGACQVQVQKESGLKIGTKENKVKAGELLERVILETQQNAMATERSAAMRSGSELMKTITMFTADSMKVFGRVVDSFGEVSVLKHKIKETTDSKAKEALQAQLKAANKKARKSVTALAATAIFMALVAQAFRWLYGKDDDDESVLETMTVDAIGNLMGGLPLIKDLYGALMEGYELNNYAYSAINDLFDAFSSIVNFSEGKPAQKVKNIVYAVGQIFGIPTRNVYNIFYGLTKKFSPTTAYEIDNAFYNKNYSADLQKAIDNDDEDMIATIAGLMLDEKVGAIESTTAKKELNSLVAAGYKVLPRSIGNSITYNGEEIALTSRQREQFKSVYSEANSQLASLVEGKAYRSASEEVKAKAIAFIWDIYYNLAIEDLLGVDLETKNTLFAKAIDIPSLAIIVATARGLGADTDKKGNVISGSKKAKVQGYVNSLGLKAAQKYMIMGYLGYSNKNGSNQVRSYIQRLRLSKSEKEKLYEYSGYAA